MKKFLSVAVLLSMLLTFSAYATDSFDYSVSNYADVTGLSKTLTNAITVDAVTDTVMYSKNVDTQISISGGIVRLMTALTVENECKNGKFSDSGLTDTEYEKLMAGMLIEERDDDARRLALAFAEDAGKFVEMMNNYAYSLGMTSTRFTNFDGETDAEAISTVKDIALLTKEAYFSNDVSAFLKSNVYTSADKAMTFTRKDACPLLDSDNSSFDGYVKMFVSSPLVNAGTVICFAANNQSGREIVGVLYESTSIAADYVRNYPTDIRKLEENAFVQYYQFDVFSLAKSVVKNSVFTLDDNSRVYASVEIPSGVKTLKLFPADYATRLLNSGECYLEINHAQLPTSAETGEQLTTGRIKYGNDVLMEVNLRTSKIEYPNGVVKSEDYVLYNVEDGAATAQKQYKKNDWILAVGLVCGLALAAVLVSEFARRKMM